ncbi:unnamed protein product [Lupinus luteus]|uniref:Protein EARLY FLOWERING 4 domain-containing protein n=1 Tax=Lupinus luteus TaxID=3873 RepID=A0AAV1Y7X1_LUPLU
MPLCYYQTVCVFAAVLVSEVRMEGDTFSLVLAMVQRWVAHTFHNRLVQVQNILGQNRVFINETNWHYEPKVPDNLSKNVGLIREFNNIVRRVADLIPVDPLIEEVPTAELLICSDL